MIKLFNVHKLKDFSLVQDVLNGGFYAEGKQNLQFEDLLSKFFNNPLTLTLNSGTSAIFLALYLAGLKEGKAVITTPITSPATNVSIPRLNGQILWADVDSDTGNINPDSVADLLDRYGDQVVAVLAVNWGGLPCDYERLKKVVAGRAMIIEDAAHALGAEYNGRMTGSYADITCFSFQAIKHITTGDGGAISFLNQDLYDRAKKLRWFGIDRASRERSYDSDILEAGFKFHMNDICAAIGITQFADLKDILSRRRQIAASYESAFEAFNFQKPSYSCFSAYWLFTMFVDNRSLFIANLKTAGIESSPVHCRNDRYTCFKGYALNVQDNLPQVDLIDRSLVCLPVGEWLSDSDVNLIIKTVTSVLAN